MHFNNKIVLSDRLKQIILVKYGRVMPWMLWEEEPSNALECCENGECTYVEYKLFHMQLRAIVDGSECKLFIAGSFINNVH